MDGKDLAYLGLGMAVGTAAALLFAPQSGEETRKYLSDKAQGGNDFIMEQGNAIKDQGKALYDQANAAVAQGKQKLQQHKEKFTTAIGEMKQAYRGMTESIPSET